MYLRLGVDTASVIDQKRNFHETAIHAVDHCFVGNGGGRRLMHQPHGLSTRCLHRIDHRLWIRMSQAHFNGNEIL